MSKKAVKVSPIPWIKLLASGFNLAIVLLSHKPTPYTMKLTDLLSVARVHTGFSLKAKESSSPLVEDEIHMKAVKSFSLDKGLD